MSFKLKNSKVIDSIIEEYAKDSIDWYMGFSGGKDSSATLKLVYTAIKKVKNHHKKIYVLFCDTGVENPIISQYVTQLFENLKVEAETEKLPFIFRILKPKMEDRFFVKVIGKGYPTPTNIFRWCTNKLRVNPINEFINSTNLSTVILGVRLNESEQRNRTIKKNKLDNEYFLKQNDIVNRLIFSPILYHELEEVWFTISELEYPKSLNSKIIRKIYSDAESECSSIKLNNDKPCGSSRFGCWTCTVVRKDKSIANQIENGYSELEKLHEFRNWIYEFRNNKKYRCRYRRNGTESLGPITLEGRKIILEKLLETQLNSKFKLIEEPEIELIKKFWEQDINNSKYREI